MKPTPDDALLDKSWADPDPGRWRASDMGCALSFLSAPAAAIAGFAVEQLYAGGMTYCADYDAGNRAGALLMVPVIAALLWLAFTIPAAIGAARRSVRVGVAVGLLAALLVAYGTLAEVPRVSREMSEVDGPFVYCTNGVPNDWWWFYPR